MIGVAGWIDVVGILQLLGSLQVFPSFMSGNTTQVFSSLVQGETYAALLYGGVIGAFTLGVLLGRLLNDGSRGREAAALFAEALLLAAALLAAERGASAEIILLILTLAMGWNNVALKASHGLEPKTYVSGALVALGSLLADALSGRTSRAQLRVPLVTWLSLSLGSLAGGLVSSTASLTAALLVPAALLALIGVGVAFDLVKPHGEKGEEALTR